MGAETLLENDASQSEMRTESPPPLWKCGPGIIWLFTENYDKIKHCKTKEKDNGTF